jgi:single-stranded DNA-binding protein
MTQRSGFRSPASAIGATELAGTLHKGDRVYCEGNLRLNEWSTQAGENRAGLSVAAWKVEKLGAIGRNKPPKQKSLPEADNCPPPAIRDWRAPDKNAYAEAKSGGNLRVQPSTSAGSPMEHEIPFAPELR